MATKSIAWNTGSGNITLTYQGQGDGTITVQSDPNDQYEARSAQIIVRTTDGSDIERTITIQQAAKVRIDISTAVVTASNQTYSGSALTPTPTVTLNGVNVPSTGYDVSYSNNTNAGTATITVTGKNDYTGTATGTFTINQATGQVTTAPTARSVTYTGSSQYLVTTGYGTGTMYYRYKLSTDSSWSTWNISRPSRTTAGTYNIEYYAAASSDGNYTQSATGSLNVTMNKASRTISFASTYYVLNTSTTATMTATPSAGSSDGTITYTISSTTYATINSSSGAVTSKTSDGSAVVTATISEGTNYLSASASYNLYVFKTTHNYSYSGSYSSVSLPPGSYKLQCWGAQGGSNATSSSDGITAQAGGKGGYSEGVLTVSSATTVRVYVGGKGSSSSGGYNGGGSTTGSSVYNYNDEYGTSRMGGGGGATDIRLSNGSLYSRMIVAGGGSGGAMCCKEETTYTTEYTNLICTVTMKYSFMSGSEYIYCVNGSSTYDMYTYLSPNTTYKVVIPVSYTGSATFSHRRTNGAWVADDIVGSDGMVDISSKRSTEGWLRFIIPFSSQVPDFTVNIYGAVLVPHTTTTTLGQVGYAGGGTSGLGPRGATQTTGTFGEGEAQINTGQRYCAGAGGGGWYGGGTTGGRSSMNEVTSSGGGSGWVNTSASAGNRPSGFSSLQLDSGTTYAGNTSFPNTAGTGNETGHSGNGYCKITRLS